MTDKFVSRLKFVVEKHEDGYVAYPLGVEGAIVGEGDTFEDALADVKSAVGAYVEAFGPEGLNIETPVLEAVVVDGAASA
jgi:predicted RNase H-like HicB family nuclease